MKKNIYFLILFVFTIVSTYALNQKDIETFLLQQLSSVDKSSKLYILDQIKDIKLPIFVPELKKLANSKDVIIRLKSAYVLSKVYNENLFINILVGIVNDKPVVKTPDSPISRAKIMIQNQFRAEAVKMLGELGDEKVLPIVSKATTDEDGMVADAAYYALAVMSKNKKTKPLPELMEFFYTGLKHTDPKIRLKAVKILGELKDKPAVNPLVLRLKDYDKNVREESLLSLGKIGELSALQDMIYLKTDKEDTVRSALARSLGYFSEELKGSTDSLKISQINIVKGLLMELMNDVNGVVRIESAASMLRFSDRTGIELIKKGLDSEDIDVKIFCIETIGNYGTKKDFEIIERFLQDPNIFVQTVANVNLLKLYIRK